MTLKTPAKRHLFCLLCYAFALASTVCYSAGPTPLIVENYWQQLQDQGFSLQQQGLWLATEDRVLHAHQATTALPAASLTKVATTLAALKILGPDHRFITLIGIDGSIRNGRLEGDLIVTGSGDPFFVWEEAFLIANLLRRQGIRRITGDMIVSPLFYMNFDDNPRHAGQFLHQALDHRLWPAEARRQFATLPADTPLPAVIVEGKVRSATAADISRLRSQAAIRHYSFPLAELLKKMNLYSNNKMAEMIARTLGGAGVISRTAAALTHLPAAEIQLINGSGLGEANRISPRAAAALFQTIQRLLKPHAMSLGDVFAITGRDLGVLSGRPLPPGAVLKSGSLNKVSALAGALPGPQGFIWFALINTGQNLHGFRREQERLLAQLSNRWGRPAETLSQRLAPGPERRQRQPYTEILPVRQMEH